jgi:hypothetical protein
MTTPETVASKPTTEQYEVRHCRTNAVLFTAEISVTPDMLPSIKLGLAVRWGRDNGADLRGADLSGADLRDADLSGAVLRDADLSGADLSECPVKIPDIHKAIYQTASQPGALDMSTWHCGTTHCRAGWVVTLAGEGGKALEWAMGTPAAAALIYMASDPKLERIPDFYNYDNAAVLEDMRRLAEASQ